MSQPLSKAFWPFLEWRGITSQRLQVFDDRKVCWLRQIVAGGVAAVAVCGEGGVVNLAPLDSGQLGIRRLVQDGDLPSQLDGVVVLLAGEKGAGENLGPCFGVEHVVDG